MSDPGARPSALPQARLAALAEELWLAQGTRVPIAQPSTGAYEGLTVADAYAVQDLNLRRRLDRGERPVGHKVGLTSKAMQEQLGVDQPDFGVITDAMVVPDGGVVDVAPLVAPRLEAEFAFRIGSAVPLDPSPEEVRAAIDGVAVSLELIDSRIADWRIALVDTIADNASSSGIVVGPWLDADDAVLAALPATRILLARDGEGVAEGAGAAVLGDPLIAVHWLARTIGALGRGFAPGDTVLAGAVAASVPLVPGAHWTASAPGFAPVSLRSAPRNEA